MPDTFTTLTESQFDQRIIENAAGVRVSVLANGCLQWITVGPTMINLFVGHPLGGGPMRLLIRKHDGDTVIHTQAVGPESTAAVSACDHAIRWAGTWNTLNYTVELILHETEPAWAWRVTLDAAGDEAAAGTYDAILVQDVGFADRGQIQNNEAYTSQYLDHQIFDHETFGPVIATRQNLAQHGGQHPQLLTACTTGAAGALTDAFDFFGLAARAGHEPLHANTPTLPTRNRQYEFSCHVLQSRPICVAVNEVTVFRFVVSQLVDHPEASHVGDLARLNQLTADHDFSSGKQYTAVSSLVNPAVTCPLINGRTLSQSELEDHFGEASLWRHVETIDGEVASFFTNHQEHVVLPAKELKVERRHAHLMTLGSDRLPGGATLCNTAYMSGIFASHVCLGNTSFNKLLSVSRDPLNLSRYSGLRLFVRFPESDSGWQQLGCPSVFRMGLHFCVWDYHLEDGRTITVICRTLDEVSEDQLEQCKGLCFQVMVGGGAVDLRLTSHLVLGDREHDQPIEVLLDQNSGQASFKTSAGMIGERYPESQWSMDFLNSSVSSLARMGGAELLDGQGQCSALPYLVAEWGRGEVFSWFIEGALGDVAANHRQLANRVEAKSGKPLLVLESDASSSVGRLNEALPWFDHNASIHLTAPHGIEQYGGAAWGVRDVCQGPVEWLLARGEPDTVARILEDVFSHQYTPGSGTKNS
ncbi:MAG: hypothetical protein AAF086_02020, partial [Planctomycetota bacterium]